MNKSLIWIATGVAGIGFGIPAYAAMSSHTTGPITTPAPTVVSTPEVAAGDDVNTTMPSTPPVVSVPSVVSPVVTTATSIEDARGACDEADNANDDRCTGIDASEVPANTTANSVEDVSGPCDEAEHANDANCTAVGSSTDDNSGHDAGGRGGNDDLNHSGHGGGSDG